MPCISIDTFSGKSNLVRQPLEVDVVDVMESCFKIFGIKLAGQLKHIHISILIGCRFINPLFSFG